jgi:hypothetical protein
MHVKKAREFVVIVKRQPWRRMSVTGSQEPTLAFVEPPPVATPPPVVAKPTGVDFKDGRKVLTFLLTVVTCLGAAYGGVKLSGFAFEFFEKYPVVVLGKQLRWATAGLSAAVFVTLADKIVGTSQSILGQLAKPDVKTAAWDAIKILIAFTAFGLSVLLIKADDPEPLRPEAVLLLQMKEEVPKGILPLFFSKNAKLKSSLVEVQDVANRSGDIWQEGTSLSGEKLEPQIDLLVERIQACASRANQEEPIVLQVRGFASSREFKVEGSDVARQDSDALNLRAGNDRARSTLEGLEQAVRRNGGPFVLRPLVIYDSLAEMRQDLTYMDRIWNKPIERNEDLTRRSEIRVLQAPGCAMPLLLHGDGQAPKALVAEK